MIWLKLLGGVGLAAAIATGIYLWRQDIAEKAVLRVEKQQLEQQLANERQARKRAEISRETFRNERDLLKTERERHADARPVRLCRAAPRVPAAAPARDPAGSAGSAGSAAGPGVLPPDGGGDIGIGPDIGPALRARVFDHADDVLAACRALYNQVK